LAQLNIVGRINKDEVIWFKKDAPEMLAAELPICENLTVGREVGLVLDTFVSTEWHIELALSVEATHTLVSRAVEVVEQLRRSLRISLTLCQQPVEMLSVPVVGVYVVANG